MGVFTTAQKALLSGPAGITSADLAAVAAVAEAAQAGSEAHVAARDNPHQVNLGQVIAGGRTVLFGRMACGIGPTLYISLGQVLPTASYFVYLTTEAPEGSAPVVTVFSRAVSGFVIRSSEWGPLLYVHWLVVCPV